MPETTSVNLIAAIFIAFSSVLMMILPRRFAIFPMLMAVCYITIGQAVIIAGLRFPIFRILILCGFLRLFIRKEIYPLKLNHIDKAIVWWVIISIFTGVLLEQWDGFINRLGLAYSALGCYFLFRFLIRDHDDILSFIKMIVIIIIPLTMLVMIEKTTGRNIFSIFGGVPEITIIRNEKLRCQGPFRHPILMGTFAATLVPFFISLWFKSKMEKIFAIIGIVCATIITYASSSSGPLITYISGLMVFLMWPLKYHMRAVRWVLLITFISLQFIIMKSNIWWLIGRLSNLTGGTGWHRSELIDTAIKHIDEWWLIGTTYTAHWMWSASYNPDMVDITNQFIYEGVNGGIWRMGAFIIIIVMCYSALGKSNLKLKGTPVDSKIFNWSLGAALFAHIMSFISVSYFDQIIVFWYLLLATISSSTDAINTKPSDNALAQTNGI